MISLLKGEKTVPGVQKVVQEGVHIFLKKHS